ncbi:MAG: biotin transporter BioY [Proteobacteria bacterium]|nr:biotin transporter BioY [Pseudomonadota bacterium]
MTGSRAAISHPLLGDAFLPGTRFLKNALLVIGGSFALAVSAKIQVPFWPVPITMQSMVALLIGVAFGSRLGALTILAYLAEGVAGLPVFAGMAAGPAYLVGPTGGYLLGFLLGGAFAGWAAERGWGRDLFRTLPVMLLGHVLIFAPGTLWLAALMGWNKALAFGIAPFALATLLKSALGAAIVAALWKVAAGRRAD